jgi:hypothetical protein
MGAVQMSYKDGYSEDIEIPEEMLTEVQRIIVDGLIRDGEFKTRDAFIEIFENEVKNSMGVENQSWTDALNYCIFMLKNAKI